MSVAHDGAPLSGLPAPELTPDPFVLLERVTDCSASGLTAVGRARGAWWAVIEAAAQACCWHQRRLADFSGHCFLLSVDRASLAGRPMRRPFTVRATLGGQASMAAGYAVLVTPDPGDDGCRPVSLAITAGRIAVDDAGRQAALASHYRKVWSWLMREP